MVEIFSKVLILYFLLGVVYQITVRILLSTQKAKIFLLETDENY